MKTTLGSLLLFLCCALAGLTLGCTTDSKQGLVTGTVTFDGEPLKTGTIRFDPVDGRTPSADTVIAAGKYTAKVPPGEKRISITSPKVVGKRKMYDTPESPVVDLTEEMVPKRYNAQTELSYTVSAGSQEKDFTLTSGK